MEQRPRDCLDVLAVDREHYDHTGQRDDREELQPAAQQAWGEGHGHVWGQGTGAEYWVLGAW